MGELDQPQVEPLLGGAEVVLGEAVVPAAAKQQIPAGVGGLKFRATAAQFGAVGHELAGLLQQLLGPPQKLWGDR